MCIFEILHFKGAKNLVDDGVNVKITIHVFMYNSAYIHTLNYDATNTKKTK